MNVATGALHPDERNDRPSMAGLSMKASDFGRFVSGI
jgi:hypothetical protein